ncbi:MAG: prepilin-type N-terminal cleavage/methylation domain-containing protein [Zetaproteobacteria bacterium]|nr:prepilin-type N-terminal cleavage/methylation domain-containing protein [Zetaproteobacteria bacterium]
MRTALRKNRGLTLVEVMVVVAVLAILASLSVRNFRSYHHRLKRAEVRRVFDYIHEVQEARYFETDAYMEIAPQGYKKGGHQCHGEQDGFQLQDCHRLHYNYRVEVSADQASYLVTATGGAGKYNKEKDGCYREKWTMTPDKEVTLIHEVKKSNCGQ